MKPYEVISFLFLLFTLNVSAQNNRDAPVRQLKNAIHLSSGYYLNASLEYERVLYAGGDRPLSVNAALTGGYMTNLSGAGPISELKGILLTGKKVHHMEFTAGGRLYFDRVGWYGQREYELDPDATKSDFLSLTPSFTLGYRYQKPRGIYIFRIGSGVPVHMFYISLGFAF
jgi:hypothetical protein